MRCANDCDPVIRILRRRRFLATKTAASILAELRRQTGLSDEQIMKPRGAPQKHARHMLFQGLRGLGWSYPRIGHYCNVHHTTAMAVCRGAKEAG